MSNSSLLQYVEAGNTRIGQRVKFPGKKAWWEVAYRTEDRTVVKRGAVRRWLSDGYKILQEPFDNLEAV